MPPKKDKQAWHKERKERALRQADNHLKKGNYLQAAERGATAAGHLANEKKHKSKNGK